MQRFFIAIAIPDPIRDDLIRMQNGVDQARWLDREDFHLTLAFLGVLNSGDVESTDEQLRQVHKAPFLLRLNTVGWFGKRQPHCLWAGLAESPALIQLHRHILRAVKSAGIILTIRKFHPHVTLARLSRSCSQGACERFSQRWNLYKSRPFCIDSFHLYSTRTLQGGTPYLIEASYPLRDSTAIESGDAIAEELAR